MKVLEDAVVRLLKSHPFYGHFLLGFRRRIFASDHALGVTLDNGTPTLCVNPAALALFTPAEQRALLEHVLKHVLHLHPARRKGRHSGDWDLACDLAINPTIEGLPAGAICPARQKLPEGLSAEEYYRLTSSPFDTGNLEGRGHGDAALDSGSCSAAAEEEIAGAQNGGQTVDDHALWQEADSTPERLAEEAVRTLAQQAWRKAGGEVPSDVRELVDRFLSPPVIPWRRVLRQFVATAGRVGKQNTWQRENRRFGHDTLGVRKRRRLNLLVAVDVSDSTNEKPLREAFARELLQIARGRDSQITVLYAGSRIQRIDSFRSSAAVAEIYREGGYTDLRPVFDYARTMHPRPAAVIYLTDGIGPAPPSMEFPTLWVLTPEGEKPAAWGVELRLSL